MLIDYFRGGNFFDFAFYNPVKDDFELQVISSTSTQIVAVNPGTGAFTTLTGTGFPASNVPPLSGTLTGFAIVDSQFQPVATITDISWGLQATLTALEAAVADDALGLLLGLLSLQDITLDASAAVEGIFDLDFTGVTSNITIIGSGFEDDIFGGDGNDTLAGGAADDAVVGGAGTDTADFNLLSTEATIALDANGDVIVTSAEGKDRLEGVEAVQFNNLTVLVQSLLQDGTTGSDNLRGSSANDRLTGLAGNDRLDGRGGDDTMEGGLDNDTYIVDSIGDVVQGEVSFSQGGGIDTVFTSVNFTAPANIELVRAQVGAGNLSLTGNDAPGTLVGNEGNNTLNGRGGNDQINGNAGNDTIIGGEGRDTLVGGAGADTFVFSSVSNSRAGAANRDVLNGFTRAPGDQDIIDLQAIDANTLTFGVNDAFSFIGTAAFAFGGASAGQLRLVGLGGPNAVVVEADINGDRVADLQIFINGQTTMVVTDFIL